jgi:hypothetical protein
MQWTDLDQSTKEVDKSVDECLLEARSMRRILHFCDLPKNKAAMSTSLKKQRQNG